MNGSTNHLQEVDARPIWFCPEDEMKIWWACTIDPAKRYKRLIEFAEANQLNEEGAFWRKSLTAVGMKRVSKEAAGPFISCLP